MIIELTVADQSKNGFIGLARWNCPDEATARNAIQAVDALVDNDMEPNLVQEDYFFVLDLHLVKNGSLDDIINGDRLLPLQIAMRLAPEQVTQWLNTRPDPDSHNLTNPILPGIPA